MGARFISQKVVSLRNRLIENLIDINSVDAFREDPDGCWATVHPKLKQ